jgi:hypothetical protein
MMRITTLLLLFTMQVSWATAQPDIIVRNRLENSWNLFMLNEVKQFTNNLNYNFDPLDVSFKEDIVYNADTIGDMFDETVLEDIRKIEKLLHLDILGVKPTLYIKGFGYKIDYVDPQINLVEDFGNVGLRSKVAIRGIEVFAKEMVLKYVLTSRDGRKKLIEAKMIKPSVRFDPNYVVRFRADIDLEEDRDKIETIFKGTDFRSIQETLETNAHHVTLNPGKLQLPRIQGMLAGVDMEVNVGKVEALLGKHNSAIKKLLLGQLGILLGTQGLHDSIKEGARVEIQKDQWIGAESRRPDDLVAYLRLDDLKKISTHVLEMEMIGDFCVSDNVINYGIDRCRDVKEVKVPKNIRSSLDLKKSRNTISKLMQDKRVMFVSSISENFINKLISSTFEANLWEPVKVEVNKEIEKSMEKILGNREKPDPVDFGDIPPFIRMDSTGNSASVYLTVKVNLRGFLGNVGGRLAKLLMRVGVLEFPLKADITMKVVQKYKQDAEIRMTILDLDLDPENLLYGIKDYELRSNLQDVRGILRKTVVKVIRNQLLDYAAPKNPEQKLYYKGYELPVGLKFQELNGMNLGRLKLYSDGIGRLNLYFREKQIKAPRITLPN